MPDSSPLHASLTNSLSDDILLLSTFLSGRHGPSSKLAPGDENLTLVVNISTLLTIDHPQKRQTADLNAVYVKTTPDGIDFLVSVDNGSSDNVVGLCGDQTGAAAGSRPFVPVVGGRVPPTVGKCDQGPFRSAEQFGGLFYITPKKENGQKHLVRWDSQTLDKQEANPQK